MALPQMTEAQRAAALKKAAVTRKKRSEFRAKIKAGKITAKKALAKRDDPIVGKIKVSQFIQSFPGYGKAKAEKIMTEMVAKSYDISDEKYLEPVIEYLT